MATTRADKTNTGQEELKVLRVGVVRDKKVVDERIVKAGEPVTIGTGKFNSFSLAASPDDIGARYELFEFRNGAYHLRFTPEMSGMVKAQESSAALSELINGKPLLGQKALDRKRNYSFVLNDDCKGKVDVGEYSFLFQFVYTPAVVTQHKAPIKDSLFDDDDYIFLSFLGSFAVAMGILMWWITVQPRPELLDKEEAEALIAEYLELDVPDPVEEEMPTTEEEIDDSVVDPNKTPVAEKPEEKAEPEETAEPQDVPDKKEVVKKADRAGKMSDSERKAAEAVVAKSFLIQQIGTAGSSNSGVVTSAFGGEGSANKDLDQILDGVTDGQIATNDAQMRTIGQMDKSGKATTKVGVVSADGKGGSSTAGSGPTTVAPKSSTKIKSIESAMGTCSDEINKTVRKYLSQVKTCHDISLKNNPDVAGRVEVDVEIMDGKVTMASVSKNTTGDSSVGSCIERKIKRWKFSSSCSDIAVFPFALSPKK